MKQKRLDIDESPLTPGLVGLVEGVARLAAEDADELLGISSAAFCNYVFVPEFNQHEESRREFSPLAPMFSNYGPWDSIGYYTGWDVREVNGLNAVETLKVVVFELEQDRAIVTLTPDLEPTIVTGYRLSVDERIVETPLGEFTIRDKIRLQGDNELFKNWLLLVRPGEVSEWAATPARQQINAVRWAAEHGESSKEFFQETRENYAPGFAGIQRFRSLLHGLTDPAGVEYAERYVRELCRKRDAAAHCLRLWAPTISAELENDAVGPLLIAAGQNFERSAQALREGPNFADAMRAVEPHERAAVRDLVAAVAYFPAVFGT